MRTFSENEMKEIKRLVEEMNSEETNSEETNSEDKNPKEKQSACERMVSAYITHLPDKEPSQGKMMVERIYMGIDGFYEAIAEAEENPEQWIEESLDKIAEDKSTAEACETYYDMAREYVEAVREIIPEYDADGFLERLESIYVPGQAADERYAEEQKELLKELILHNSALMQKLTESMIQYAAETMSDDTDAEYEYEEDKERDLLAVMAMAAYIAAKEGKLEDVPSEITLDELTIMVCAMYESSKVVQEAEKGSIAWDIAKFMLELIGIVAMTKLVIVAAEIGFKVIAIVFGSVMTSILSVIMVMSIGYWTIKYGFKLSDTIADGFMDSVVRDTVDAIGEFTSFSFGLLKDGMDKIKEFLAWARAKALAYAEHMRPRKKTEAQGVQKAEQSMEKECEEESAEENIEPAEAETIETGSEDVEAVEIDKAEEHSKVQEQESENHSEKNAQVQEDIEAYAEEEYVTE